MLLSIYNVVSPRNLNLNIWPVMKIVILIINHLSIGTSIEILSSLVHVLVNLRVLVRQLYMLSRTSSS